VLLNKEADTALYH